MDLQPPVWAQTLLAVMVAPERFDEIAGDLLEEFRAAKAPQLGIRRAGRWYGRQVAGYLWRASWPWIAAFAVVFVAQDLSNAFRRPDGNLYFRPNPQIPIAPFALILTGFLAGRRTRSVVAGLLMAGFIQAALIVVMAIWWNVTFYPFAQVMQHNPYWIEAWHYSGAGESFARWAFFDNIGAIVMATLVLLPAAVLLGTAGAFVGKLSARWGHGKNALSLEP
jgi:hypothetical protein